MDRLAQELIDEIIDHLDKPDLKSCSLVSRSFLPRTRTHLFQHITIPSQRKLQVQDLPRAYIRSIHLTGHVGVPLDLPNISHASFSSILYTSDPFIHSLKGVHTISFTGTSIFIRDPAVLSAFLARFPHLTTLNVDCYMQFRSWEQPKDVPKIDKLRVELKGSYTRWVIALVQNVRRLELINASASDIEQILDAGTNIQQLVLRSFQIGLGLFDMSNLVQLSIDLPDQRAVDYWEAILLLSPPRHVHIALYTPSGLPLATTLLKLGVEVIVEPHCKLTEEETQEYKALLCPVII